MSSTVDHMNFGASSTRRSMLAEMQAKGMETLVSELPYDKRTYHPLRIEILGKMLGELDGTLMQDVDELKFSTKDYFGRQISHASNTRSFNKLRVPGEKYEARIYHPKVMFKVMSKAYGLDETNDIVVRGYHLLYSVISIHYNMSFERVSRVLYSNELLKTVDKQLTIAICERDQNTKFYQNCPVPGRKDVRCNLYSISDIEFLMESLFVWFSDNISTLQIPV